MFYAYREWYFSRKRSVFKGPKVRNYGVSKEEQGGL